MKRQSSLEAISNYAMLNVQVSSPSPNALRFSVISEVNHLASILALLKWCRPATVAWFVIPVVVNAVDACSNKRPFSHVSQKVDEGMPPSVAYTYSSCAVVFVLRIVGIVASGLHHLPRRVFWCSMTTALRLASASARLCASLAKIATGHSGCVATLAAAKPHGLLPDEMKIDHDEISVGLPAFVFDSSIDYGRVALSHLNLSYRLTVVRAGLKRLTSSPLVLFRCPILQQVQFYVS